MRYESTLVSLLFVLTSACASDPTPSEDGGELLPTVGEALCERADACNTLAGSVKECIQEWDAVLNPLPKHQRDEVELALKQCIARPSCDGFLACITE